MAAAEDPVVKVRLMHPDRNFDPQRLLPGHAPDLQRDLALDLAAGPDNMALKRDLGIGNRATRLPRMNSDVQLWDHGC